MKAHTAFYAKVKDIINAILKSMDIVRAFVGTYDAVFRDFIFETLCARNGDLPDLSDVRAAHEVQGIWQYFESAQFTVRSELTVMASSFQKLRVATTHRKEFVRQAYAAAQVALIKVNTPIPVRLKQMYDEVLQDAEYIMAKKVFCELKQTLEHIVEVKEVLSSAWPQPALEEGESADIVVDDPLPTCSWLRSLCVLQLWTPVWTPPTDDPLSSQLPSEDEPLKRAAAVRVAAHGLSTAMQAMPLPPLKIEPEAFRRAVRAALVRAHPDKHVESQKKHFTAISHMVHLAKDVMKGAIFEV